MNIGGKGEVRFKKFTIRRKKLAEISGQLFLFSIGYRPSVTKAMGFYNKIIKITSWLVIRSLEIP